MNAATFVQCVNVRGCGYEDVLSPPPVTKPHCPKCGGPTLLDTRRNDPLQEPQVTVGKPVSVNPPTVPGVIPRIKEGDHGTDSVPFDDGAPPL